MKETVAQWGGYSSLRCTVLGVICCLHYVVDGVRVGARFYNVGRAGEAIQVEGRLAGKFGYRWNFQLLATRDYRHDLDFQIKKQECPFLFLTNV